MNINFGGHPLFLHPAGVLIWPEKTMLIVADLHLEKSSHHAKRGYFLPPYDTHETLVRLINVLEESKCKNLMILGDCFHDPKGYKRLNSENHTIFQRLLNYNPLWITGNHDGEFVPPDFNAHHIYKLDGLTFIHEAADNSWEISAHYHPKADLHHKGEYFSYRCFVQDGNKLILPAFGSYTGGLSVENSVFKNIISEQPNIYAICSKKILKI